jgi:branched-chain amino acid aminotransferase group I
MMHERDGFVWMDGRMVENRAANVHILTHTLHYGSGVFEGERAYNGEIFKMEQHHRRLHESAQMLGFEIPYSVEDINAAAQEVLLRNNLRDAYIRPMAWHGSEALSVNAAKNKVHLMVAAWEWPSYFKDESEGLKLTWSAWSRPSPQAAPVRAKANGQYITGTMTVRDAQAQGFHDGIMKDYRGYLAEISSANIFFVKDGVLHTPIADCFLNGITRQTVIELARAHDMPLEERHIMPDEILSADEVFVCGTAVEIQPVTRIDDKKFPIGDITKTLRKRYANLVRGIEG